MIISHAFREKNLLYSIRKDFDNKLFNLKIIDKKSQISGFYVILYRTLNITFLGFF